MTYYPSESTTWRLRSCLKARSLTYQSASIKQSIEFLFVVCLCHPYFLNGSNLKVFEVPFFFVWCFLEGIGIFLVFAPPKMCIQAEKKIWHFRVKMGDNRAVNFSLPFLNIPTSTYRVSPYQFQMEF